MSCRNLQLAIDAGIGIDDDPRLREHLAGCAHCRQAMSDAQDIALALRELPELVPTPDLEDAIMRQVATIGVERIDESALAPTKPAPPARSPGLVLGGLFALAASFAAVLDGQLRFEPFAPLLRGGIDGLANFPPDGPLAVVLAIGLMLMLSGLAGSIDKVAAPQR